MSQRLLTRPRQRWQVNPSCRAVPQTRSRPAGGPPAWGPRCRVGVPQTWLRGSGRRVGAAPSISLQETKQQSYISSPRRVNMSPTTCDSELSDYLTKILGSDMRTNILDLSNYETITIVTMNAWNLLYSSLYVPQWYIAVSFNKCTLCKSLWIKASAKCPKCKYTCHFMCPKREIRGRSGIEVTLNMTYFLSFIQSILLYCQLWVLELYPS